MEKPAVLRQDELKRCRKAIEVLEKLGYDEAVKRYPECKEVLAKYLIQKQGVDE